MDIGTLLHTLGNLGGQMDIGTLHNPLGNLGSQMDIGTLQNNLETYDTVLQTDKSLFVTFLLDVT